MHSILKMYMKLIKKKSCNLYSFYNLVLNSLKMALSYILYLHFILLKTRVLDVYIKVTFWSICLPLALATGAPIWWMLSWKDGLIPFVRQIWSWISSVGSHLQLDTERTWLLVPALSLACCMILNKYLALWAWVFPFVKLEFWSVSLSVPPGFIILCFLGCSCLAHSQAA